MTTSRSVLTLKRNAAEAGTAIEERLHKVLANAGLGSRRMLESRIEAGDVQVNGVAATLGQSVRSGDRVEMDGKRFVVVTDSGEHAQVLIYNKPDGVVATREDPEGRPTVFEDLPQIKGARWIAVGRLDINTTGLLLLTTDGDLANALMHPSAGVDREYICRVHGEVPDEVIERLRSGVELDDGPAHFDEIAVISRGGSHSWFRVVLHEGRNREVRRMWESQGLMVSRLKRIRYGNIELPRGLLRGQYAELDARQVAALRERARIEEVQPRLTLAPVIGQRRATPTEFRPNPKAQQAWTGARNEEAREFAAFDRMRDDGWRGTPGKKTSRNKRNGPPRKGARPGGTAGGGAPGRRQPGGKRNAASGQHKPPFAAEPGLSPAVLRSWFPDAPTSQPGRRRRGARPGMEQPFHSGQFQPASGNQGPRQHARGPGGNVQRPDARGNKASPRPRGGQPGNSIHDGPQQGRPGGRRRRSR